MAKEDYKLVTVTHVDTSTGVLADIEKITKEAKKAGCLVVVDGVAAAAGAECRIEEWGIDVYLTASQKAVGVPPGLALLVVSLRAVEVFNRRRVPVPNYYASFANWLPIMEAYKERRPAYFGTPAVNLVYALETSLAQILEEGLTQRFARHTKMAAAFRSGIKALGLEIVPVLEEKAAPTLSAVYFPANTGKALITCMEEEGVVIAGGLHPQIKGEYFRIGHMGACSTADIITTVSVLEQALQKYNFKFEAGAGVTACQQELS